MCGGDGYFDLGGHDKGCYRSFIEVVAFEFKVYHQETTRCLKGFCGPRARARLVSGQHDHDAVQNSTGAQKTQSEVYEICI